MIKVLKASGELEEFSQEKIRNSLERAGAAPKLIDKIIAQVENKLYNGISTHQIYSYVFGLLQKEESHLTSRYNLKQAIMEFGPTGYPFEKFVAGVLEHFGYKTQTNQIINGKCVKHEIDVIAHKNNQKYMLECKFHNRSGEKVHIKDALYVYARFLDVKQNDFEQGWLVTNTKVTRDTIDYGKCMDMKIISWNYPADFCINYLIEKSNLHPITTLNYLTKEQKRELLKKGIVFAKDLPTELKTKKEIT